jgi:biopolymer transport protein ExbB
MKNMTNTIIMVACLVAAYAVFYLVLGAEGNFTDPKTGAVDMHNPQNALGMIYTGGWLVGLLIASILIAITFVAERFLSIGKAGGKGNMHTFSKDVVANVQKGNYAAAISACDAQRGSLANVLRAAVERYKTVVIGEGISRYIALGCTKRTRRRITRSIRSFHCGIHTGLCIHC